MPLPFTITIAILMGKLSLPCTLNYKNTMRSAPDSRGSPSPCHTNLWGKMEKNERDNFVDNGPKENSKSYGTAAYTACPPSPLPYLAFLLSISLLSKRSLKLDVFSDRISFLDCLFQGFTTLCEKKNSSLEFPGFLILNTWLIFCCLTQFDTLRT